MKLGDLNDRIEIYTVTATSDGEGGSTVTYTLASTRWANVKQLSESEIVRSGQVTGQRTYRIIMNKSASETLSKSIQIRFGSMRLNVSSIVSDSYQFTIIASSNE